MCALFGFLDFGRILPQKILRELTQALANSAEERGTDASGISYIKNGKVSIYKRPKPAHKLRFNFPAGIRAVMGWMYTKKVDKYDIIRTEAMTSRRNKKCQEKSSQNTQRNLSRQ